MTDNNIILRKKNDFGDNNLPPATARTGGLIHQGMSRLEFQKWHKSRLDSAEEPFNFAFAGCVTRLGMGKSDTKAGTGNLEGIGKKELSFKNQKYGLKSHYCKCLRA